MFTLESTLNFTSQNTLQSKNMAANTQPQHLLPRSRSNYAYLLHITLTPCIYTDSGQSKHPVCST